MGCCGCFVASVFRKNPWFLRGFRAFRTTACCVPLDAVLAASRRAPREFEAILGGVGGSGARPLKLALSATRAPPWTTGGAGAGFKSLRLKPPTPLEHS